MTPVGRGWVQLELALQTCREGDATEGVAIDRMQGSVAAELSIEIREFPAYMSGTLDRSSARGQHTVAGQKCVQLRCDMQSV